MSMGAFRGAAQLSVNQANRNRHQTDSANMSVAESARDKAIHQISEESERKFSTARLQAEEKLGRRETHEERIEHEVA